MLQNKDAWWWLGGGVVIGHTSYMVKGEGIVFYEN